MIKPSIGRVVLVHRAGSPSKQPEPALICYVHGDQCINVGGFDYNGVPFAATSVFLDQDGMVPWEGAKAGTWAEWMPFQKAVAAGDLAPTKHAT